MNDRLDRMFLSIFVYLLMNGVNDLGEIICDTCVFLIDCCTVYLFIYLFVIVIKLVIQFVVNIISVCTAVNVISMLLMWTIKVLVFLYVLFDFFFILLLYRERERR